MQQVSAKVTVGGARRLGSVQDASGEQLIEVWSYTDESGADHVELVEHSWGSGLGWYPQKRLSLDAEQIQALRGLLDKVAPPPPPASAPRLQETGRVLYLPFAAPTA